MDINYDTWRWDSEVGFELFDGDNWRKAELAPVAPKAPATIYFPGVSFRRALGVYVTSDANNGNARYINSDDVPKLIAWLQETQKETRATTE